MLLLHPCKTLFQEGWKMKARTLVSILIFVLAILIIFGSCATGKKAYVAKENEELYGIWINKKYDVTGELAKRDYNPDGTWAHYLTTTKKEPEDEGIYTITEKWTDDMGNVWYKLTWEDTGWGRSGYGLIRIGDSGTTLEAAYSWTEYPTELDRTHYLYYGVLVQWELDKLVLTFKLTNSNC